MLELIKIIQIPQKYFEKGQKNQGDRVSGNTTLFFGIIVLVNCMCLMQRTINDTALLSRKPVAAILKIYFSLLLLNRKAN